jgi:hypothetical protein
MNRGRKVIVVVALILAVVVFAGRFMPICMLAMSVRLRITWRRLLEEMLEGRWAKRVGETEEQFVGRLTEFGDRPIEIIKALRGNYGLGLNEARALVATEKEIDLFLRANKERGLSLIGISRLASWAWGMGRREARQRALASGLWEEGKRSLP